MDDFGAIFFIILWLVISIIGSVMKKKKKEAEASKQPRAPRPVVETPEIPPILREILGLPKEQPKVPPPISEAEIVTEEIEEPEVAMPEEPQFIPPVMETKIEYQMPLVDESKSLFVNHYQKKSDIEKLPIFSLLKGNNLKQAILLKEILDKPRSLNRRDPFRI